jgi:hypothetical protein
MDAKKQLSNSLKNWERREKTGRGGSGKQNSGQGGSGSEGGDHAEKRGTAQQSQQKQSS